MNHAHHWIIVGFTRFCAGCDAVEAETPSQVTMHEVEPTLLERLRARSEWSTTDTQGRYEFHVGPTKVIAYELLAPDPEPILTLEEARAILGDIWWMI